MAEHFEYKVVPAQMSCIQNFQVKSVLCIHENTVILHLLRNMTTQFGIVDLSQDKFKGIFGMQYASFYNQDLRGKISPDCSVCLIELPQDTVLSDFKFQLYDLKTKDLISEYNVSQTCSRFAFDPRFNWTRLAATNFVRGRHTADTTLSLVHVKNWDVMVTNPKIDDIRQREIQYLADILFSKDGFLIFAVMVSASCHCRSSRQRRNDPADVSIIILNADTADTIHCIQYHRYTCGEHLCQINYMPLFSQCGSRMAIVLTDLDSGLDHVQIYKLPSAMSLQNRCRVRILQHFGPESIHKLPLPNRMLQFLRFHPEYE